MPATLFILIGIEVIKHGDVWKCSKNTLFGTFTNRKVHQYHMIVSLCGIKGSSTKCTVVYKLEWGKVHPSVKHDCMEGIKA